MKTLFGCGGNRLNYLVADLFRILRVNFYQNCPRFVEDMIKTFGLLFYWTRCNIHKRLEV